MIKGLHGKYYYMVLKTYQEVINLHEFIESSEELKNEFWTVRKINDEWVMISDAPCKSFRGPKYHAWEQAKRFIYKSRRPD